MININRMTCNGDYRFITRRGKAQLKKSMEDHDILTMERLLVQELRPEECQLNDGEPEYRIIDGNHRVVCARETFPNREITWLADVVSVLPHTNSE